MDQNQIARLLRENQNLRETIRDRESHLSALGQDISSEKVIKDFYVYDINFPSLASGATATGNVNIQADSDFVVQKLTYFADIAAAGQTSDSRVVPLVNAIITDTGSGRQLMDVAVPIPSIFGTGEIPFILSTPKLFTARSTINVTVANFDAANSYNLKLSFVGYKVFRMI